MLPSAQLTNHIPRPGEVPALDEQNAALLVEQKSKSTFRSKMRFAEMLQSVSYATQLI
jgi:hypothetical protein